MSILGLAIGAAVLGIAYLLGCAWYFVCCVTEPEEKIKDWRKK